MRVVAVRAPPEQLFDVVPSTSKNDAACPAGAPASSQVKSNAILTPLGPASEAETCWAANGRNENRDAARSRRVKFRRCDGEKFIYRGDLSIRTKR